VCGRQGQGNADRRGGGRPLERPPDPLRAPGQPIGQRRAGREDGEPIDDDMILEITVEAADVGVAATVVAPAGPFPVDDGAYEGEDLTRIRDLLVL
jgi:hypothetical protein